MAEIFYTKEHEYIRVEGDVGTVGISNYAQEQLGDIVFVELPEIGKALEKGGEAAVVESVKAASEIYAPIAGSVTETNSALEDNPASVNEDSEGAAWFLKLSIANKDELKDLMDTDAYAAYLKELD